MDGDCVVLLRVELMFLPGVDSVRCWKNRNVLNDPAQMVKVRHQKHRLTSNLQFCCMIALEIKMSFTGRREHQCCE